MSPISIAWFILLLAGIDALSRWYRSRDIDYREGECWEHRFVSWGTCRSLSGMVAHDFRYFRFMLPMWSWRHECWSQLVISKFAGRWEYYWLPERP